jgi:hypothetical protein
MTNESSCILELVRENRMMNNTESLSSIHSFTVSRMWVLWESNGINNTGKSHWQSHDNPHGTVKTNFQRRFSISMWCGMIDDMLIGPVILDDHMTGHNYVDFLQNALQEQIEVVPLATIFSMTEPLLIIPDLWCSISMTLSLIGGSVEAISINWPPRSPDLTPLDFCLWGWMKSTEEKWLYETNYCIT